MREQDRDAPGALRKDDPRAGVAAAPARRQQARRVPVSGAEERPAVASAAARAAVYLEVQRSGAFREVRGRYRRFAFPAAGLFLLWYLAYVVAATAAPDLMSREVAGPVNVAMAAGLGQFASTFLLAWAYARHARLRRDRAALELRWETQERTR